MRAPAVAVALFLAPAVALAQYGPPPGPPPPPPHQQPPPPPPGYYPPPPEPPLVRDGLVIGASIGVGGISETTCDDCGTLGALALQLQLGGMLTPNLALVGDASMMLHGDDEQDVTHGILAVAAQWWVLEKVWLKGGLGAGRATFVTHVGPDDFKTEDSGTGILLGAGIEFMHSGSFVLDVQGRLAVMRYSYENTDDHMTLVNTGVHLGFNWY